MKELEDQVTDREQHISELLDEIRELWIEAQSEKNKQGQANKLEEEVK